VRKPNNKIILLPLLVVARIACDRTCVLPTPLMYEPLRLTVGCPFGTFFNLTSLFLVLLGAYG